MCVAQCPVAALAKREFVMDPKLARILSDVFQVDRANLTEDTKAEDIESWDSLKHLELVTALEQAYGVELGTEEIPELRSVADIVQMLRRHNAL